ncbi:MAG: tRNA uridine-5-carboxymethylaminomethyl(34) synthesis GTPase MnmE [Alphaproteobacteria bacterium]|nr:MAG: tRNA uridine-5-carboxymethylaminomethyl(34) synthesis GTPase MnmE [Alphaproteobacteria bacterium]
MTAQRTTNDTIIALASGSGRAGVAVIRASGPGALGLLAHFSTRKAPEPRVASVRELFDGDEFLDEAVVLSMPGPNSYTGEDVVEFHVHGGPAIIEAVLASAVKSRLCRIADPGEFTRRAFDAGRMDLTQAEAIGDLIDAETEGQRRQAGRLYQGEAARTFEGWRGLLVSAMAALEASIDFPDEADIPGEINLTALEPIETLAADLEAALGDAGRLRSVREGFRVAILGPPNAGKSSLMNRLARREAAIVSPVAGTTRDVVEVRLVLAGYPVWVADTAGLREASDAIEAEGVKRALARAEEADLRIWVSDASDTAGDVSRETLAGLDRSGLAEVRPGDLKVLNKADLVGSGAAEAGSGDAFVVSAKTGAGFDAFERRLAQIVREQLDADEPPLVTRARHRELVEEALAAVERGLEGARIGIGAELVSEDLRLAARALGRITGSIDAEDLLDRIFSKFCVGK